MRWKGETFRFYAHNMYRGPTLPPTAPRRSRVGHGGGGHDGGGLGLGRLCCGCLPGLCLLLGLLTVTVTMQDKVFRNGSLSKLVTFVRIAGRIRAVRFKTAQMLW